jgi:hypothetical protein
MYLLLHKILTSFKIVLNCRCGNVAAILELDENLNKQFRVFEAAPHVRAHWHMICFFFSFLTCYTWHLICSSVTCRNREVFLRRGLRQITFSKAAHVTCDTLPFHAPEHWQIGICSRRARALQETSQEVLSGCINWVLCAHPGLLFVTKSDVGIHCFPN